DVTDRSLDQRQPVGRGRHRTVRRLLPRVVGDHEQEPIEGELVTSVDREHEMTDVWWIESPAEHPEALTQLGVPPSGRPRALAAGQTIERYTAARPARGRELDPAAHRSPTHNAPGDR